MGEFSLDSEGLPSSDPPLLWLSLEFVDGGNLRERLEQEGNPGLPEERVLEIARELLCALGYMHGAGILHRDLKPANVLCTREGRVKLADFGLARPIQVNQALTRVGEVLGTPYYMAPEQCLARSLDPRADLYSLGCLLFTLLVGEAPYVGQSAVEVIDQHLNAPVPDARVRAPSLSRETSELLQRLMAKRPQDRFSSAREVLARLRSASSD